VRSKALPVVAALLLVGTFASTAAAAGPAGFKTAKAPYLVPCDAVACASANVIGGVVVDPIISTGDIVGGYQMSGIPDGLGAYKDPGARLQVLMNHELGATFPATPPGVNTRISKLTLNRATHGVQAGTYLFNGSEGFERFCSSTLQSFNGTPYYLTGEEAINAGHDGSSIVMNAETGQWVATPQFGHVQHENVVPVERLSKAVAITTDDDFRVGSPALLLAYIADTAEAAVSGDPAHGSLYVWKALDDAADTPATIAEGDTIAGEFVPLTQAENTNSTTIKTAAAAKHAFRFSRLEDAATAQQTPGRLYIADTGKIGDVSVTGRIYQLDIDPADPTKASLTFLLDSATHGFANPDNLDTSSTSLVFQEDREANFRSIYNRVLVYNLEERTLKVAARVDTTPPRAPGQWESSGVINAQTLLGGGWWLLDVQAHGALAPQPGPTAPGVQPAPQFVANGEDGQLLAIYIPGS
jgi:hypothetical protein